MGGTVPARIAVVAGLALAAALTGCGSVASDHDGSSPESSGPAHPAPTPSAPSRVQVDWPIGGWDIHYREDGKIKVLKVEDFPR